MVISLESDSLFPLTSLYTLSYAHYELALKILEEWRLDRYYCSKGRLLDMSLVFGGTDGDRSVQMKLRQLVVDAVGTAPVFARQNDSTVSKSAPLCDKRCRFVGLSKRDSTIEALGNEGFFVCDEVCVVTEFIGRRSDRWETCRLSPPTRFSLLQVVRPL